MILILLPDLLPVREQVYFLIICWWMMGRRPRYVISLDHSHLVRPQTICSWNGSNNKPECSCQRCSSELLFPFLRTTFSFFFVCSLLVSAALRVLNLSAGPGGNVLTAISWIHNKTPGSHAGTSTLGSRRRTVQAQCSFDRDLVQWLTGCVWAVAHARGWGVLTFTWCVLFGIERSAYMYQTLSSLTQR